MGRIDMHRLQELVRLHRMGTGKKKVARLLGMSPRIERDYRAALERAAMLDGPVDELPSSEALLEALAVHKPRKVAPQQVSSVERWTEVIEKKAEDGAGPTAIYDFLRLTHTEFDGTLSAVKRVCTRLRRKRGVLAEDVVIRVETPPGDVAQVDFGYAGKLYDPKEGRFRDAWVFVMVLGLAQRAAARVLPEPQLRRDQADPPRRARPRAAPRCRSPRLDVEQATSLRARRAGAAPTPPGGDR